MLNEIFARDGVVRLRHALDDHWLEQCELAYQYSLDNPSPLASWPFDGPESFYQDLCSEENWPAYAELLEHSPLADIVIELWGTGEVWFMYEQVFKKARGTSRRTPWHQDSPYLAIEGEQLAVLWISFEPLSQVESLELVRGSHRGPLYDGSRFDPNDDTAPIYGSLPRLPDIEADRDAWDIVSYPIEPGDLVAFHPMTLHGGAPSTARCPERRTLSLRFFGADAVYRRRPGPCGPRVKGLHEALSDGDPFRSPSFYRLR